MLLSTARFLGLQQVASALRHPITVAMTASLAFVLSGSAEAELLAYHFTDVAGKHREVGPAQTYVNPQGDMTFILRAGVDRRLEVELRSEKGQSLSSARSPLIGANDRIVHGGGNHYGTTLTLPSPEDGSYKLYSRILSASGDLVFEETFPVQVVRADPTPGEIIIAQAIADAYDGIDLPLLGHPRFRSMTVKGMSAAAPLDQVRFDLLNDRGHLIRSYSTPVTNGQAAFVRNDLFTTGMEGQYRVVANIFDAAGNVATTQTDFYYDSDSGIDKHGRMEPVAIYDPSRHNGQLIDGAFVANGYVPYTPGIGVSYNPIRAIYKVKRENFWDYSPFGIGRANGNGRQIANDVIHRGDDYIYIQTRVHGQANLTSYGNYSLTYTAYDRMLNSHTAEPIVFTLLNDALIGPQNVRSHVIYSDGREFTGHRYLGPDELDLVVEGARVEVAARPYRQRIRIYNNKRSHVDVILAPGETIAYANLGISIRDLINAGDEMFVNTYHRIYGLDEGAGFQTANLNLKYTYFDAAPPEILDIRRLDNEIVVETFENQEGSYLASTHNGVFYVNYNASKLEIQNASGAWINVPSLHQNIKTHWYRDFHYSLTGIPEGRYTAIRSTIVDRFGNESVMTRQDDFVVDRTPPSITVMSEESIGSLDEIVISLTDNLDSVPVVTNARITGGPANDNVNLASVRIPGADSRFALEYPIMFPSLEAGEAYTLTVTASDGNGNFADASHVFVYMPRIVGILGDEGEGVRIPAVNYAFTRPDGLHLVATDSLTLSDGSQVAGVYDVFATLRSDSEMALVINGVRVEPGATMTVLPSHNFGAHQGKINIPVSVADYQAEGRAMLLLSTTAPNAPIVLANIDAWAPGVSLSPAESWSVYPGLDELQIRTLNEAGHCQAITSDPLVARYEGNPVTHPICLIEWQNYPRELYETDQDGDPQLTGYLAAPGNFAVRAHLSVVTPSGHKVRLDTLEHTLDVMLPDGSIKTRLNPEVPVVERLVESIFFTVEQTEGPKCSIITTNEELAIDVAGRGRPSCLLTWEEIPAGLEEDDLRRNTPSLQGTIEYTEGDTAVIAWTMDAFTPAGTKVPMGRYTKTLDVIDPPLPTFEISSRLHLDDDLYAISLEGGYLGDYTVEGRPVAIWTREHINGELVGEEEAMGFFSRANRITRRMIMDDAPLWSYTDVELEAFYSRLPEMVSTHSLRVLAVPSDSLRPVIALDDTTVLNTEEMEVSVALQDPYNPNLPYSAETMGEWEVRLMNYMSLSNQTPLTEFQPLGPDGTATFLVDPKQIDATGFRLIAQARVISPEPLYEREVISPRPLYVTVLRGEAIGADITGRRFSGPAPLTFIGMLELDNRLDQGAMGEVVWELRHLGQAEWQPVEDTGFAKGRIMKTFQAGKYELRARIPNVNSGAEYITEVVQIHAFDVPSVDLQGPWNVFIGDTGTYRVNATVNGVAVAEDEMEVLWSLDDGATWTQGGASMEVSSDKFERVTLRARTRLLNSDADVDDAWVERRGRISFRPVLPPRAGIVGPRVIEMGTEHEWRSVLQSPFRHMDVNPEGYFLLPDGTRVDGEVLRYTPTEADLENGFVTIGFVSWIDGFPETHNEISQRIRVWIYEWPRWDFYSRLTAVEAPATLNIRVRSPGIRARYIEGLSYEWHLPEGVTVEQARSGDSRVLSFEKAGSYPITVDIRDDRGHHSTITRTIVLDEQTPWEADYRLTYSNDAMREPLTVGFRPMVSGGHPRDRVSTFRYLLNGEVVASDVRYGSVKVPVGEHEIAMQFDTEFGHTVEKRERITVAPNQVPTCKLDVRELDASWRFYADCQDRDGSVVGHRWEINGEVIGVSGSRISITRRGEAKPSVALIGIDDAGGKSEPVHW